MTPPPLPPVISERARDLALAAGALMNNPNTIQAGLPEPLHGCV